ncbi:MAG: GTP-sensing pleiotropic transcriptional regulator CodY [Firmicutes bacterium]|nr:GTP-sensing pleiotropic transcriptional regulator CodY [Bacillota bacterium]
MLLKRMQNVSQVLQNEGNDIDFHDLAEVLRDTYERTSVYLVSRKGKVLGYALEQNQESTDFDAAWINVGRMPMEVNSVLLKVGATTYGPETGAMLDQPNAMIVPVVGAGRRVGTLLFLKSNGDFDLDDQVIAEHAATAAGMIISAALIEEEEDEAEERRMARSAIKSLSYSEILAMQHIFDELQGDEGLLVASRIADEAGITRSVIVNALRKLASANVIESRSLGMKGTYLRILNKEIRAELEAQRYPFLNTSSSVKQEA